MLFPNCCRPFTAVAEVCTTNTQESGGREDEMNRPNRPECIKVDALTGKIFFYSIISICLFTRQPLAPQAIFPSTIVRDLHQLDHYPSQQEFEKALEKWLPPPCSVSCLLLVASSLALCTPLERPVFAADNVLEERNSAIVRGI